jgi:hypothetical protein
MAGAVLIQQRDRRLIADGPMRAFLSVPGLDRMDNLLKAHI